MKLFNSKTVVYLMLTFFIASCATYKKQISEQFKSWEKNKTLNTEKSNVYLIGDAGNSPNSNETLQNLKKELQKEGKNSSVIFLGDNVYPKGLSSKKGEKQEDGINKLNAQIDVVKNYKGQVFFIPGNHDWYHGTKGLNEQEDYIKKALGKHVFLPKNGCPLEVVHLNDKVDVIFIDSQWYITNWNKHPQINDKCNEIKTREKFFIELEGLINKSQNKITLLAMHHPTVSMGTHGGNFSLKSHLFPISSKIPLPGLGTVLQTVRKASGLNSQDIQSYKYTELVKRVTTLAKEHERIVFVSGHDHNLQYLYNHGIPQIVSGSGSKKSATRLRNKKGFSYGEHGYAKLSIHENDKVTVVFKSKQQNVFETTVFKAKNIVKNKKYDISKITPYKEATIYTKDRTEKGKFYKALWGEHYRKEYSIPVKAKTVWLDTLYGGLSLVKKGGGHQSKSLRLVNPQGKQYVMRALKKSATRFLQSVAFKEEYITDKLEDTYTENLVYDFYTSAHPYTPFVVGDLSSPLGVYHTNPKLFYVPKQNAIAEHDDEFGDALYMIEERPEKHHSDVVSFGEPDDIVSTDDLFKALRKSKKNKLDEENYVRARLFDMMVGDWDRHVDQWRWAVFYEGKNKIFRPIPRDRDQAFSSYDGNVLEILTRLVDPVKLLQTYTKEVRNLFKFSDEPYPMDVSLIQEKDVNVWMEQAAYIKNNLTDETIDKAFDKLPNSVKNAKVDKIKTVLKYRRDHIEDIALEYKGIMEKFAIVKGTDKDDLFEISGTKEATTINVYNLKNNKKEKLHFSKTFKNKDTKEVWVYGLDDDDVYEVNNIKRRNPKLRLIGGQNKDTYNIQNSRTVHVHDFKSKKNTFIGKFRKHLTNEYSKNTYHYKKTKDRTITTLPLVAYNPDDGLSFGASFALVNFKFNQQPFTDSHKISFKYFTATQGFDFSHSSEFATDYHHWNFVVDTRFTTSNFSNNFFGFGNNTENLDDDLGLDYNRVRTEIKSVTPGIVWNNLEGSTFKLRIPYQIYEIEETENRFLNDNNDIIDFDAQDFVGVNAELNYERYNNKTLPTLGFHFNLVSGWDYNLSEENSLYYIKPSLGIIHPLFDSENWVIASKIRSHFNLGNDFQIYQSAFVGGNNGLRGFRNERFAGKRAYSQNTDIRYTISEVKTAILPVTYGVAASYDYGRVWLPSESSQRWHNSYGGSFWMTMPGIAKINLNLYNSTEGARFTFGVGVNW